MLWYPEDSSKNYAKAARKHFALMGTQDKVVGDAIKKIISGISAMGVGANPFALKMILHIFAFLDKT